MASEQGETGVAWGVWVAGGFFVLAAVGVVAGPVWRARQLNNVSANAATAPAAAVTVGEESDGPEDRFRWRYSSAMLTLDDRSLQRLPRPTFAHMLQRIAPRAVGSLVELAPAAYRFVPIRHDDTSDMRAALEAETGVAGSGLLPGNLDSGPFEEFGTYLAGRRLYESGDAAGARERWSALLDLEPERRHWRSTWAAFMIGRSYQEHLPSEAAAWFRRTRELAAEGFADSLGLAVASIGWEARTELDRGNVTRAIALYLEQFAAGDPSAHPSLHAVVRSMSLRSEDWQARAFPALARDPVARAVITAWAISGDPDSGYGSFNHRWCRELGNASTDPTPNDDVFAWLAMLTGHDELVRRWIESAPSESDLAPWLRSRLAMQGGDRNAVIAALEGVVERMPESDGNEQWKIPGPRLRLRHEQESRKDRARAELAAVVATGGDFERALTLFVAAGAYEDAAYLAERVLDADELACFVDAMPAPRNDVEAGPASMLRHLLARRLVRLGRLDAAMEYIPGNHRPALRAFGDALATGNDPAKPAAERAEALRAAGTIARRRGMELMGTEYAPDCFESSGMFGADDAAPWRATLEGGLVSATAEEVERTARLGTIPEHRFHYRYVAADLAWQAASMLPDDDPVTAETLWEGGRYLIYRDDRRADRFYKALVRRCRMTPLGMEADMRRWFPRTATPVPRTQPQTVATAG